MTEAPPLPAIGSPAFAAGSAIECLEILAGAIADARSVVEAGGLIDLSGLDGAAEAACRAAVALPAAQRRQAAERLIAIGAALDALGAALAANAGPPREGALSRTARAERAYRNAAGRDG